MRPRIVAGNWKMNTHRESARQLALAAVEAAREVTSVEVILCPPFPYLSNVVEAVAGSRVKVGGQNCHAEASGAYTGEVSAAMLRDVGCDCVILGHSERRHGLGESDGAINFKVHGALEAGLRVLLCVGETIEERRAKRIERVLARQVAAGLAGVPAEGLGRIVLAYEPVWAIGTGETATPEQAQEAHAFLRRSLGEQRGEKAASAVPILYGGSVKGDNARGLFAQPDVDGGLIGGASLKAADFKEIIRAAAR